MAAVIDKPAVQCAYRNYDGERCPLDAEERNIYCTVHARLANARG